MTCYWIYMLFFSLCMGSNKVIYYRILLLHIINKTLATQISLKHHSSIVIYYKKGVFHISYMKTYFNESGNKS